jgi:hypothetical protein
VPHFAGNQTLDIDFDVPPSLVFHNQARGDLSAEQLRDEKPGAAWSYFFSMPRPCQGGGLLPYD